MARHSTQVSKYCSNNVGAFFIGGNVEGAQSWSGDSAPDSKKRHPPTTPYGTSLINVAPCHRFSGLNAVDVQRIGRPSQPRHRLSRVCQVVIPHHDLHVFAASRLNGFLHTKSTKRKEKRRTAGRLILPSCFRCWSGKLYCFCLMSVSQNSASLHY